MTTTPIPNLKKLRTERLLTQVQLGEAIGISPRTLIRWEAGTGEPGASELVALATFFGVSIDQLVADLLPPDSVGSLPRVVDLSGAPLNYWVARAQGLGAEMVEDGPVIYVPGEGQRPVPPYCTDWAHGGPIMDASDMIVLPAAAGCRFDGMPRVTAGWIARPAAHPMAAWGSTKLEAGMRAYLLAEMGERILT